MEGQKLAYSDWLVLQLENTNTKKIDLARATGVSRGTITNIANGNRSKDGKPFLPSTILLVNICRILRSRDFGSAIVEATEAYIHSKEKHEQDQNNKGV